MRTGFLRRTLTRFARATGGLAAMEFALIAPVMIALYFGVTEISDGMIASSKMTAVTSTAADLVGQDTNICNTEMTDIFSALSAIMYPYPLNSMKIIVTSLVDAGSNQVKVAWSDAQNGTARTVNSIVAIPTGLVVSGGGGSVIMVEVTYNYSSPTGSLIYGSVPLSDKFYERPRRVNKVTRTSAC